MLLTATFIHSEGAQKTPRRVWTEKSPLFPTPSTLKRGKTLYAKHCAKCHGPEGKGDGPDKTNDLAHRPPDLTKAHRIKLNPEGVLFKKIWNGFEQPEMPGLKGKVSRLDAWAVVEYVKMLRQPHSATRGTP